MSLESGNRDAQAALEQAAASRSSLTERQKMLAGKPYLAMTDADLTNGRLRTRPLLQAFNNAPWPKVPDDRSVMPPDFYGPERRFPDLPLRTYADVRPGSDSSVCAAAHSSMLRDPCHDRAILEELFGLPPGDVARLGIEIEPQFACDYGDSLPLALGMTVAVAPADTSHL